MIAKAIPSFVVDQFPPDGETPGVVNTFEKATSNVNGVHKSHTSTRPSIQQIDGLKDDPYAKFTVPLRPDFAFTPRKLRVVTIGAGFSGLLMAHKFQHRFPETQDYIQHTIFEARHQLGGTWLVNTYPGVQCDVPSHTYTFPFDPNPDWDRFYSSGAQIQEYLIHTAKKWNLDRDIQFNSKVTSVEWMKDSGEWRLVVEKDAISREVIADVLISGQGVLCHPNWPSVPGLQSFRGKISHSAEWDHNFDYSNKRIAVIGNGSSGIQIVPKLVAMPGTKVTNFIRGPAWIYYRVHPSKHLGRDIDESNPAYTEEEKRFWRENPEELHKYRKGIINRTNKAFKMFKRGESNNEALEFARDQMAQKLKHDKRLCEMLIPKWEVGCRRVTPGPGYLEAVVQPNCHITNSPITKVTENAVHTADGQKFEVDVLVCATGFDVSHRPRFPIIGLNGVVLADKWKDEPASYLSLATSDMPNYFIMLGPNAVVGHGSLVEALNWTGDYIVKWIKKIATEDIKSVVPKSSIVDAFISYGDEIHKTLIWTGGCKSWYKRNTVDGRITALFGGSALLFRELIQEIRGEHFDIEYRSINPWRFMGNGFTEYETKEDADLSFYVERT